MQIKKIIKKSLTRRNGEQFTIGILNLQVTVADISIKIMVT
ncbi:MAG: hypothetical protein P1P67_06915 [Treponema phagedenis]|nr:hypothetical protein [Treponema phagedenis]